jgi:hypothetical protein
MEKENSKKPEDENAHELMHARLLQRVDGGRRWREEVQRMREGTEAGASTSLLSCSDLLAHSFNNYTVSLKSNIFIV